MAENAARVFNSPKNRKRFGSARGGQSEANAAARRQARIPFQSIAKPGRSEKCAASVFALEPGSARSDFYIPKYNYLA